MLGTAVVVLVLAAAGCGGGGGGEAASPTTTGEPSPTSEPTSPSTTLTDEEAVLAAYQGYWDTWLAANDPPNPDHPDLERYATGAALRTKVRESHRAATARSARCDPTCRLSLESDHESSSSRSSGIGSGHRLLGR